MARKKKLPKNPTAADLPQNPEFQAFLGGLRQIMSVPKTEIDRLLAEERALKAKLVADVEEIEERLAGSHAGEPE